MNTIPYYLVDVFTDQPFGGNPLAVFPEASDLGTARMQQIANELNLSETTFIQAPKNSNSHATVRIFTPKTELPMAGHPTIGSAFVMLKHKTISRPKENFLLLDEGIGQVRVDFSPQAEAPKQITMHQSPATFGSELNKSQIAAALGLEERAISPNLPVCIGSSGVPFIIVPLRSLKSVEQANYSLPSLRTHLGSLESFEILAFSLETSTSNHDVHCRMFAPRLGVPEDPATGSAHGPLACYLHRHGLWKGTEMRSEQGLEMGRPSSLTMALSMTDDHIAEVAVSGTCVDMGSGQILLHP